jgi:pimeloyl-ACP methyl ester carboxylesterase
MKALFYNWEGLYEYVLLGYAVVATDYAGLGIEGRHAFVDMQTNAADVVNSVPAARAAVHSLGAHWVAIGHSQGGLAALGVAQLQAKLRDPNFLGTVALAGAGDLEEGIRIIIAAKQPFFSGLLAFIAYGAKTVEPDLDLQQILTNRALELYNASVEDGCRAAAGAFTALSSDAVFKPGWDGNEHMQRYLARNRPGAQPTYGPLFIVTGGADPIFREPASRTVLGRLCAGGRAVQRNVYAGLGHDPVVYGSLRDQLAWIAGRFSGQPTPSSCPSR